jgi:hypothetical protein
MADDGVSVRAAVGIASAVSYQRKVYQHRALKNGRLTAQLFHDRGNVVFLKKAYARDAGGSGFEAGLSVG